jgi:hypothetical protein
MLIAVPVQQWLHVRPLSCYNCNRTDFPFAVYTYNNRSVTKAPLCPPKSVGRLIMSLYVT